MRRDGNMRREGDRSEASANAALSATAKMRSLDVLHGEISRERRRAHTLGERKPCKCGPLAIVHLPNCPEYPR